MPRRRRHDVVAVAIAALACAAAACQADSGDAGCQLAPQQTLPGTPLTLLANARLDQVGGGYFLLGNDDTALRWGAVSADGSTLTGEQSYALPSEATALYYAMAGLESPGDTVLLGYLRTATSGTGAELAVLALPAERPRGQRPAFPRWLSGRDVGGHDLLARRHERRPRLDRRQRRSRHGHLARRDRDRDDRRRDCDLVGRHAAVPVSPVLAREGRPDRGLLRRRHRGPGPGRGRLAARLDHRRDERRGLR